jgi:hypothetical protein
VSAYLSPIGGAAAQFFNNQGVVLAGGKLYTYMSGSTTPQATWVDYLQNVQNSNPVILNSAGRPPNEIWLAAGANNYKFVIADSNDVVLGTFDNVQGISTTATAASEWATSGLTITYVSGTQFSVSGDQRAIFPVNRRVQYFLGAGTFYGYVSAVSYNGTSTTTVTIAPDATNLDSSITSVNYAVLNSVNVSVPQQYLQSGVPINGTVIGNITPAAGTFTNLISNNVTITGGTITGIAGFSVPDFLYKARGVI